MFLGVFHDRRQGLVCPSRFFRAPRTIFKKKMGIFEAPGRRNCPKKQLQNEKSQNYAKLQEKHVFQLFQ